VYTRVLFAITEAIKKWRQYLVGRHFFVFTDQKSLKELMVQTIQTPEQQKWAAKLQGFSFEIHYKPGKNNLVADALSRKHIDTTEPAADTTEALLLTISSSVPDLLSQFRSFYTTSQAGSQLIAKFTTDPSMQQLYLFKEGLLFFKERIYVPNTHN